MFSSYICQLIDVYALSVHVYMYMYSSLNGAVHVYTHTMSKCMRFLIFPGANSLFNPHPCLVSIKTWS